MPDEPQQQDGGQGEPQGTPAGDGDGQQGQQQPGTDWRAQARKWETRAKENAAAAKELADIKAAQQSAEERAQAAAKAAEDRAAAAVQRVASAEIRAALTGVVPDPAAVVEDLNLARFITAEGDVDAAAVEALRAKYSALAPPPGPRAPAPNPAQGSGGQQKTLTELIRDAEGKQDRTPAEMRELLALKSRQALNASKG